MITTTSRLQVVDALRGFALVSIMLLHNLEHFDFYFFPSNLPLWLYPIDKAVWETLFFLFSGKSYAIFSILFGVTFYIQYHHQALKGLDFRARFAWRMLLLLGFGMINSCLFQGDILSFYAVLGVALIVTARMSDRWAFIVAVVLLLQPYNIYELVNGILYPQAKLPNPLDWAYMDKMTNYITKSSLGDTVWGNLTNGKVGVVLWSWEAGRIFQAPGLFILGMLAGRRGVFDLSPDKSKSWRTALIVSILVFIPLFYLKNHINDAFDVESISRPLISIVTSLANLSFVIVLIAAFVLLFQQARVNKALNKLSVMGRMSLTNYIFQSILGSFVYYGFGLAMYQYTGATYSLLIGILLVMIQWQFCNWWLKTHKQGPLEWLWHKWTWM